MKTMKTNRIIAALLTLLGFGGCIAENDGDGGGGLRLMYGPVPVTYFVVDGAVTDADEKPLENIRVVLKLRDDETDEDLINAQEIRDTVYTDDKGRFRTDPRPDVALPWAVIVADVDGADNGGEFQTEEKTLNAYNGNFDFEERVFVKEMDFTLIEKEENDENE